MAFVQNARKGCGDGFYKSPKFCMSTKLLSKLSEVKWLNLLIPSFSNCLTPDGDLPENHFRYTDHDMKFTKQETELKETWHKYQSSVKSITIGDVLSQFPKFDEVCQHF